MFKKVLVPVDLSQEASQEAIPVAMELTKSSGGEIVLLNVQVPVAAMVAAYLPPDFESTTMQDVTKRMEEILEKHGLAGKAEAKVRQGPVYHEVIDEAKSGGYDLIVMSSHHPELADYLLGSNAANVIRHADCSVLVLRT